jgi:hypothetical protein
VNLTTRRDISAEPFSRTSRPSRSRRLIITFVARPEVRDAAVKKISEGYVLSGRSLVETMTPVPGDPPRIPFTYWAQRKDRLFLTLECPNAEDPKVHLTDDGVLTFSANAKSDSTEADHHYELKLELLHPINAKDSQIHVGPRRTTMVIAKTEEVSGRRDVSSPFFSVSVFRFFSRVPPAKSRQVTSSAHLCADSRAHHPNSRVWKRTPLRRRPSPPIAKNAGPHWPRLLRSKEKNPHVKTDFDKWVDEDEEDEADRAEAFDLSSLESMSKYREDDFVDPADSDDEDEDMPPLERAK